MPSKINLNQITFESIYFHNPQISYSWDEFFSLGNRGDLHRASSDEYGAYCTSTILFFIKKLLFWKYQTGTESFFYSIISLNINRFSLTFRNWINFKIRPTKRQLFITPCILRKRFQNYCLPSISIEIVTDSGSSCHRKKLTRNPEFKSWTSLFAFHMALIPLGKV